MAESNQVTLFYTGAMLHFDVDDFTVDRILADAGLELTEDTIAECAAAVREWYYAAPPAPEAWKWTNDEPYGA